MLVGEMIYWFLKDYEEVSRSSGLNDIPDTETILVYLNKAQERYLRNKYLYGKTVKENTEIIMKNSDDLYKLIRRDNENITAVTGATDPYTGYAGHVNLFNVTDYHHYIRSDVKITRTLINPFSTTWVPTEIIDYSEVGVYLTNPFNHPIIEFPKVLFEDNYKLLVIYDDDTTIAP